MKQIPYGMSAFFERLDKTSPSESSVPVYTRTHPLTEERIADMSERARRARYRQPQQDPEYGFVRAQLIVAQADSEHEYVRIRQVFKNALHSETTPNRAADAYGIALTYLQTNQIARARESLEQAQCLFRLGSYRAESSFSNCKTLGHAVPDRHALSLDILDVEVTRLGPQADPMKALALAQTVVKRWPDSRAAQEACIKAYLTAGQYKAAQTLAREQARLEPYQSIWWRYAAQASAALNDSVGQQRALAEEYALEGAWPSAIVQLETARKTPGLDFYMRAQIESRIKEIKALYKRAQEEEKNGLPA
jgi:predicted Zn-dependent protease